MGVTVSYLILPACYLLGAIPVGVLYGRLVKRVDIRQHGSGNPGASNILRLFGLPSFIIVFTLDVLKGFGAVHLCRQAFGDNAYYLNLLGGLLSIVGHTYSVFLRFAGGRGVATGLGLAFAVAPLAGLLGWAAWGVVLALTRYISLASIVGATTAAALTFLLTYPEPCPPLYRYFISAAALLIVARHRPNIQRLLAGTEYKLGQKVVVGNSTGETGRAESSGERQPEGRATEEDGAKSD
jgi:glycerol-3-phosphate acyltransferase PlsY